MSDEWGEPGKPAFSLGPYTFDELMLRAGEEAAAAIVGADALDPDGVTEMRMSMEDKTTGRWTPMPALCLTCGFLEGADPAAFTAHECAKWRHASTDQQKENDHEHWTECRRRMVKAGNMTEAEADQAFDGR